ncbi:NlpC/P60 family protein [Actinomadura decatromicini]|uniref:NlpC/P60 family protein n=1 Tax=Actinomadura decatromicini TaxID=2604572 RepID=A0A5D3F414_9ACTN|nr:NlpC/P60 family protein [Actinomadura decatromicini]
MSIAPRNNGAGARETAADTVSEGDTGQARAAVRKQRALRAAVTAAATGFVLAAPLSSHALAELNPTVLRSMHLDSATLKKVRAYDAYRTREAGQRHRAKRAISFARRQIGKPYRWGADGPSGYDCSGLAMAAWRRGGVHLPRVTYAQYRGVRRKVGLSDLKPGDLIFFHGRSHVGMYVGNGRFLHAPHAGARVRIDKLGGTRKRQFAGAVRPGAPAYREWSASVKELVRKIDRMSAQEEEADQKPPDNQRSLHIPPPTDTLPKSPGKPSEHAPDPAPGTAAGAAAGPDTSPDGANPAPRPSYKADPSRHAWAKYVGPADDLTAPGHVPN